MTSRVKPSPLSTAIALGAAFTLSLLIIVSVSDDRLDAVYYFFAGPFMTLYHFGNMLDNASLLILTGLGMTTAFRTGVFNLGGEGQTYLGAIVASQIALQFVPGSRPVGLMALVLVLAASALAGGIVASLSGYLKNRFRIDELISTFLVSAALIPIIDYLISEPLRDPESYLLATRMIARDMRLRHILEPSSLNVGIFVAVGLAISTALYLKKTIFGYETGIVGSNRKFAGYSGIRVAGYVTVGMAASGAAHGLAGGFQVVGTRYAAIQGGTAGLGWNGIAVALIAEQNPLAAIPAALVFSYLTAATETAMLNTDFSFELSALIQAVVFLIITVSIVTKRTPAP